MEKKVAPHTSTYQDKKSLNDCDAFDGHAPAARVRLSVEFHDRAGWVALSEVSVRLAACKEPPVRDGCGSG